MEILFDQDDGVAAFLEQRDDAPHGFDDDRGQPFGDFVEQQQAGSGAQDAGQCQHLLFTPRESRALGGAAVLEVGEHRVDLFQFHAATVQNRRQKQVLFRGQPGKMPRSSGQ